MASGDDDRNGELTSALGNKVVFVSWGAVEGRPQELAATVGADVLCLYPPSDRRRPPTAVRYVAGAMRTTRYMVRHRPRVVVVTNPPIVAGLITYACTRVIRASIILDSHPGGFGAQGDRMSARLQPLHRWLARRCAFSIVAAPRWKELLGTWGVEAEVVHESQSQWNCPVAHRDDRLKVLFVGRFAGDEPVQEVVAAAASLPEIDFAITGQLDRCPPDLRAIAPSNVEFVGFLGTEDYQAAISAADVIMCLTTEPDSVMRSAYEAVYAGRPLILSDWPIARELFPFALGAANSRESLAQRVREAEIRFEELVALAIPARDLQVSRFDQQRDALVRRIAAL